jgi:hypothetical protein
VSRTLYTKPPALHNLRNDVFRSLMKDVDLGMHESAKKQNQTMILVFVILYLIIDSYFLILLFCWIWFALEDLIGTHLGYLTAPVSAKLKEWQPRLASEGFTVVYRVDQPTWYSWKEGYMHIARLESRE